MIKLFVANLEAYNNGRLVGDWIDLENYVGEEEKLKKRLNEITKEGEEIFIADYETPFSNFTINRDDDIYKLLEIEEQLIDLSPLEMDKVNYLLSWENYPIQKALSYYDDVDYYPDMSLVELAQQFVDNGVYGKIPDNIRCYIDYEAIARDLEIEGFVETKEGVFKY